MTDKPIFTRSFTQQEPIPAAAMDAAMLVLQSGRLHRYNTAPDEISETALLEEEFAAFTGATYALAVASGGYAMGAALRAVGVGQGDKVLSNGFTLAPVPGAIASVGAVPVFVETTDNLTIDLDDLAQKAADSGARVLLLSHMRGHICDMDRLMAICATHDIAVIEDCAHTMGAAWDGRPSGRHGVIACYSTQTYKHINSGEGGFLTTDDAEIMARAILLSGSYMLYTRHRAAPPPEVFENLRFETPNVSGRMDNLRAAILRPQLADLPRQVKRWRTLYERMEVGLANLPHLRLTQRDPREDYVGSSFQFLLPQWPSARIMAFVQACLSRGVELKWFGAPEPVAFTSRYDSWRYAPAQHLPRTDAVLAGLMDLRLPLTFLPEDIDLLAAILRDEVIAHHA
ncbi:DegT/DnrJ/EryC1/StrS family aminotransferase [Rhodobacteraceae bacterium XHP0102]|nr:DegT/DnrJ/EryC1/StrS family aminotransferase [Rhodobacteraceae bacterium XHP0102]